MPLLHTLLVLAVVFVWGTNFVVIRWALDEVPPFTIAALRFLFAALPWVLLVPRPALPWRWLAAAGLAVGPGQFGLLYLAMRSDISPGLASLLMQCQVFMTLALAWPLFHERVGVFSWIGLGVATGGLAVVAAHAGAGVTPLGLALVLLAALCWAAGNVIVKHSGRLAPQGLDMLAFMIWSSLFACPLLVLLAVGLEGPGAIVAALQAATPRGWASMLWQSLGNTLLGFGVWNWLLTRHRAEFVTPYALLVPVFGMGASALALGEPMPAWKLVAGALVMAGLALHAGMPLLRRRFSRG